MHNLRFGSHVDYSSSAHPSLYFHICSFTLICIPAQQRTCRPDAHYNNWSTVDNVLSYSTSYSWIIMKGCYKMGREREIVGSCQRLKICNIWEKKEFFVTRNPIGEGAKQIKPTSAKFSPWKCLWFFWWWWDSPCTLAQPKVLRVVFFLGCIQLSQFWFPPPCLWFSSP